MVSLTAPPSPSPSVLFFLSFNPTRAPSVPMETRVKPVQLDLVELTVPPGDGELLVSKEPPELMANKGDQEPRAHRERE